MLADAVRPDQPAHPAPPGPSRRRRPRARRVLRRTPHEHSACPSTGDCRPASARPCCRHLARHRVRAHRQLRDGRRARRSSQGGPRRRDRMRHEPAARRRALPPRRQVGRQHGRVPRAARTPRRRCSSSRPRDERPDRSLAGRRPRLGRRRRGLDDVGIAAARADSRPTDECRDLRALYDDDERFRSTIDMARHRFGAGQYRYFAHPLPAVVAELRASFWPHLLPIARDWAARLDRPAPWPDDFDAWIAQCHAAGQTRPTPLMLRYGPGDWNALHRDLYGDLVFPLQVVIGLDCAGRRLHGRRVRRRRATPTRPVASDDADDPSRTRHRVHHPRPTDPIDAWLDRCPDASRRQHAAHRASAHLGTRLPRRRVAKR